MKNLNKVTMTGVKFKLKVSPHWLFEQEALFFKKKRRESDFREKCLKEKQRTGRWDVKEWRTDPEGEQSVSFSSRGPRGPPQRKEVIQGWELNPSFLHIPSWCWCSVEVQQRAELTLLTIMSHLQLPSVAEPRVCKSTPSHTRENST